MITKVLSGWYKDPSGRSELRWWDGDHWTDHVHSSGRAGVDPVTPQMTAQARLANKRWRILNSWWILPPILSFGILGWLGFLTAAIRTRKRVYWIFTAIYAALTVILFALPSDGVWLYISGSLLVVAWIVPTVHAATLNRRYLRELAHQDVYQAEPTVLGVSTREYHATDTPGPPSLPKPTAPLATPDLAVLPGQVPHTGTSETAARDSSREVGVKHDVFICHSSADRTLATAICSHLEQHRIRCWIAPRDVVPGSDYAQSIVEAIAGTRITLLVFSDNSNHSPHVKREIERSVSHGIPILPFRVEDVVPSPSLEYFISDAHWLDAITPPMEEHLTYLAGTVRIILDREGQ